METAILSHGTFVVFQLQNKLLNISEYCVFFIAFCIFVVFCIFFSIWNENIFNLQSNSAYYAHFTFAFRNIQ